MSRVFYDYPGRVSSRVSSRSDLNGFVAIIGLSLYDKLMSNGSSGKAIPPGYSSILSGYGGSGILALLQPDMAGWFRNTQTAIASAYPNKRTSFTQITEVIVHACD